MDEYLFPAASPTMKGLDTVTEAAHVANLPMVTDLAHQGWREWFRSAGVRGVRLPEMHSFTDSTDAMQAAVLGFGAILALAYCRTLYSRLQVGPTSRPGGESALRVLRRLPDSSSATASIAHFLSWLRQEAARESNEMPPIHKPPAS